MARTKSPRRTKRQGENVHLVQLSEKLSILCARRRLTQESLGNALGIAHTTVGRWLAGKSRPYRRVAMQLADFFGVNVEDLLDDEKDIPLERRETVLSAIRAETDAAMSMYPDNISAATHLLEEEDVRAQVAEILAKIRPLIHQMEAIASGKKHLLSHDAKGVPRNLPHDAGGSYTPLSAAQPAIDLKTGKVAQPRPARKAK